MVHIVLNHVSLYCCSVAKSCLNSMERQKDMTLEDESPRLVGVQYDTGKE